jgi:hypothetical protein
MKFSEWLVLREMFNPIQFPTVSPDKNPWINGKWSTSAFQTGKAKVKRNPVQDAERDHKANTKQDGFHL